MGSCVKLVVSVCLVYLVTLLDAADKVVGSFPRTPHRHNVVRCTDDSFYRLRVYTGGRTYVLEVVNPGGLVEKFRGVKWWPVTNKLPTYAAGSTLTNYQPMSRTSSKKEDNCCVA